MSRQSLNEQGNKLSISLKDEVWSTCVCIYTVFMDGMIAVHILITAERLVMDCKIRLD
jgi:hypothetical protein